MLTAPASSVLLAHIDIPPELAGSLIALGISIVIVLVVWAVRGSNGGRTHRGTVARPGAPFCRCGMEAKWMLPQNHWHCDRCNLPVTPAAAAAAHAGPFCPACGTPGRWLAESQAWGCDRCRARIHA